MMRNVVLWTGSELLALIALVGPFTPPLAAQAAFTEEAVARGVDYYISEIPGLTSGFGVAFVDLDNDGDPDIIATGALYQYVGLFENDGTGHFVDRSTGSGFPQVTMPSAVVALDYDGDGDLDPYVIQHEGGGGNLLARNLGGFQFSIDSNAGLTDTDGSSGHGAAVGDYDNDGLLDILVPKYGSPDRLFRNLGDGTFTDVAPTLGLDDPWRGLQAVFFDMDWDGDQDIYMSNDKKDLQETEMHNRLYENVGGTFVDISSSSGTDVNAYSMGVAVGDFDRDGLQDLYCTNRANEASPLFMCRGPGIYVNAHVTAGVSSYRLGWGAAFFDYDNNAQQDLYICNRSSLEATPENRLYVHNGTLPCTDIAPTLSVDDPRKSYGLALGDVDGDGDIDLLVLNLDDQLRLYINNEGETRNWVKFRIVGVAPNHFAVGARVSIRTGSVWQTKQILAGGNGYLGQNELTVHFGLDDATMVDEVRIQWPGGPHRTLVRVPANQTHVVRPAVVLPSSDVPTPITRSL